MKRIDARGKQCPIPVVETKKALEEAGGAVEVAVDNYTAVENIMKMARQREWTADYRMIDEDHYQVTVSAGSQTETKAGTEEEKDVPAAGRPDTPGDNLVLVLNSDKMGEGDEVLGRLLMKGYLYAVTKQERLPDTVLLYNNGVKLSTEGSESLEDLSLLQEQGVEILSCGTCLNHYGLTEKLAVGEVTNMYVIAEKLAGADKIIRP